MESASAVLASRFFTTEPPLVSLGFSKKNNLQSLHFKIKMSTKVALKTVLIGLLEDFSGGPVVKTRCS